MVKGVEKVFHLVNKTCRTPVIQWNSNSSCCGCNDREVEMARLDNSSVTLKNKKDGSPASRKACNWAWAMAAGLLGLPWNPCGGGEDNTCWSSAVALLLPCCILCCCCCVCIIATELRIVWSSTRTTVVDTVVDRPCLNVFCFVFSAGWWMELQTDTPSKKSDRDGWWFRAMGTSER